MDINKRILVNKLQIAVISAQRLLIHRLLDEEDLAEYAKVKAGIAKLERLDKVLYDVRELTLSEEDPIDRFVEIEGRFVGEDNEMTLPLVMLLLAIMQLEEDE